MVRHDVSKKVLSELEQSGVRCRFKMREEKEIVVEGEEG